MTHTLVEQVQDQMRQVADLLTGVFFQLAGLAAVLPRSPQEISEEDLDDLDGDPDPATALRAVALCVMTDRIQPAIADLLATARYRPEPTSPSGAEILRRLCEVLGTPGAAVGAGEEEDEP